MPITQAQLITAARERLDEATARYWTDDMLRRWINEGATDIARKTECLYVQATAAVTGGTPTVTAPTDLFRINRIEYNRTGETQRYPLTYRDFNAMDSIWDTQRTVTQSPTPSFFSLSGFTPTVTVFLYPTPSVNGTLTIFYYRLPTQLSITTSTQAATAIEIPEGWQDLVIDYVEYRGLRRDRDDEWQIAKLQYEEHLEAMYELSRSLSDQSGFIVNDTTGMSQVPYWLYAGDMY